MDADSPAKERTASVGHPEWLAAFHVAGPGIMDSCYRDHFDTVWRAVGARVTGVDRETLVHEVFLRLISDESLRRNFHGGSFSAWLSMVARNHAIDFSRRRGREIGEEHRPTAVTPSFEEEVEARQFLARFKAEMLPAKWHRTFELRFLAQLDQPEAARRAGIHRTTLAYQEYRIRALLQQFITSSEG